MIALLLLFGGQEPAVFEARCDWVELNHYGEVVWSEDAKQWRDREILCQVIFWDGPGRTKCVAWRLAKQVRFIVQDHRGVSVEWHDGNILRRVRATCLIETWTDEDPELLNREVVAPEFRRGIGVSDSRIYPSLRIMRAKER